MLILNAKLKPSSLKFVSKNLNKLIDKVERQGKRDAIAKAGRPMLRAVKKGVSRRSGSLKKAMKGKVKTFKKGEMIMYIIGPDRRAKNLVNGKTVRAERYVVPEEFGTHQRSGSGFMRKGFDSTKKESFNIYKRELSASIKRAGKRLSKNFKG